MSQHSIIACAGAIAVTASAAWFAFTTIPLESSQASGTIIPAVANVTGAASDEDEDEIRPLDALLDANEMSRAELKSMADFFNAEWYHHTRPEYIVEIVETTDSALMAASRVTLDSGQTMSFPETLAAGDVIERGIVTNTNGRAVLARAIHLDADDEPIEFEIAPGEVLVVGEIAPLARELISWVRCGEGYFAACWRDPETGQTRGICFDPEDPDTYPPDDVEIEIGGEHSRECRISRTGGSITCENETYTCCHHVEGGRVHCSCETEKEDRCVGASGGPGAVSASSGMSGVILQPSF